MAYIPFISGIRGMIYNRQQVLVGQLNDDASNTVRRSTRQGLNTLADQGDYSGKARTMRHLRNDGIVVAVLALAALGLTLAPEAIKAFGRDFPQVIPMNVASITIPTVLTIAGATGGIVAGSKAKGYEQKGKELLDRDLPDFGQVDTEALLESAVEESSSDDSSEDADQ